MIRFSLRALLMVTLLAAVLMSITFDHARSQRRGRAWVQSQNGHVTFAHKYDPVTQTYDHAAGHSAPTWLVDLFGIDMFDSVDAVTLDNMTVEDLEPIKDLRSLRAFAIVIEIDDELDFTPLTKLPGLEEVYLDYTGIDDQRLAALRALLPNVRVENAEEMSGVPLTVLQAVDASGPLFFGKFTPADGKKSRVRRIRCTRFGPPR